MDLENVGVEGASHACQSTKAPVFAEISPDICRVESKEWDFQLYCFPLSQILPTQKREKHGLPNESKSKSPHSSNTLLGFGFSLQDTGSWGLCENGATRKSPEG